MSYRDNVIDLTDAGAADALTDAIGTAWRYVHDTKTWLRWTGALWQPDQTQHVLTEARAVIEAMRATIDTIDEPDAQRKAVGAWVRRQSASALAAQLTLAAADPRLALVSAQLDAHPMILSAPNGTIDLATGRLRPADRSLLQTRCTAAPYDPAAQSDVWDRFLADVTCGDATLAEWLRQAVGMSLIGDQREQVAIFCYGLGRNGKTTFLDAIIATLGHYASKSAPDLVTTSIHDRHPTEVMDMCARRVVVVDEFRAASSIDESKLKRLTGGGTTKARAMGKDFVAFPNTWQLWLDGNSRPRIHGQDEGIWRRMRLVPWLLSVSDDQLDPTLAAKLSQAAPAILRWAVDGCRAYLRAGRLPACAPIDRGTREYRLEQDMFGSWLAEAHAVDVWHCDGASSAWVASSQIMAAAKAWCEANSLRTWTPPQLGQELTQRGCWPEKRLGVRGWRGLDPSAFGASTTNYQADRWPEH